MCIRDSFTTGGGISLPALNPFGIGNLSTGKHSCLHPQAAHSKLRDLAAAFRFCERVAPCTEPISAAGSVMWATRAVTRDVTVHDGCQVSWWYSLAERQILEPTCSMSGNDRKKRGPIEWPLLPGISYERKQVTTVIYTASKKKRPFWGWLKPFSTADQDVRTERNNASSISMAFLTLLVLRQSSNAHMLTTVTNILLP